MLSGFLRLIVPFALIFGLSATLFGQNPLALKDGTNALPTKETAAPCNLLLSSLPRFVGVQIGMSYEDILSIYPEIEKDEHFHKTFDVDGSGLFMIQAKKLANTAKEDARQISLNFTNHHVLVIALRYGEDKWTSIQEAVSEYSTLLGTETAMWRIFNNASTELKCADFSIFVNSIDGEPERQNSMSIHPLVNNKQN